VAGETSNITPETALLEGTVRALSAAMRDHLLASVERIASHTAQAHRAEATLHVGEVGYPPLETDIKITARAHEVLVAALGTGSTRAIPQPYMTAEDFAYYLQAAPGTFLFLGNDLPGESSGPGLHTPTFNFNDAALPTGVATLVALARRFTGSEE
jgi:metal-dependent amidase/aminoacylase/carboxypeptidase family protein